jgi:site-specific DNA-methyltransferase (adenine-specific)
MLEKDKIVRGDCIKLIKKGVVPQPKLIFADPPFNIGYKYDVYEDRRAYDEYRDWTRDWMEACAQVLHPEGSFWVAIGDEYAAEVRLIAAKELGLHPRNWVIWHYTFGQNTKSKFARSHTHLFYFVKDQRKFTFNDAVVRVLSDRQKEYGDRRANVAGKVPDDVWTEFPRVCGTFGEREGWHPCQMPEMILARIVRACSDPGDLVFDPFAGSGTTLVVAKKLNRHYFGTDISKDYVQEIEQRLQRVKPLSGVRGEGKKRWPQDHKDELRALYQEGRLPTERLRENLVALQGLVQQLNARLMATGGEIDGYAVEEVWKQLERLRKGGKLGKIRAHATEPTGDVRPLAPALFEKQRRN